jgi:hypothetical protein
MDFIPVHEERPSGTKPLFVRSAFLGGVVKKGRVGEEPRQRHILCAEVRGLCQMQCVGTVAFRREEAGAV